MHYLYKPEGKTHLLHNQMHCHCRYVNRFPKLDIGGHTLMRAAAKNHKHVSILTNPNQYSRFIKGKTNNLELAKKAFAEAMKYDIAINNWINDDKNGGQTVGNYYEKGFLSIQAFNCLCEICSVNIRDKF